jgi:hypothetical protein
MEAYFEGKRRKYIPPRIKSLTEDEARRLLAAHAKRGNVEAAEMLKTLEKRAGIKPRFLESA